MPTHKFFTSRVHTSSTVFVGDKGRMFYDESTGELRLSDGHTPGGVSIAINATVITTESILPDQDNVWGIGDPTHRWNHLHIGDGGIYFDGNQTTNAQIVPYLPGTIDYNLVPRPTDHSLELGSSTHRWGNVWIGSASLHLQDQTTLGDVAMTVNNGTLFLNGVQSLAVGSLTIIGNTLTSLTNNLDINIGAIDDTGVFYVNRKAHFDNTSFSSTEAMVSFNASGGADPATVFPDTVMQTVSRPNKNSRIVQRSYGSSGETGGQNSYSVWASYVARGSTASPAALKKDDILARISVNGFGTSTWGSGGARVEFVALENFTDSAKGTKINFWTTPEGQITSQNVATINSIGLVAAGVEFSATGRIQTDAGIPITAKAVSSATYVATLGSDGKLDSSQIPSSLSGAIIFKGGWDAAGNSPALSNTTPAGLQTGWEYVVIGGGTRDIGDGPRTFVPGDFVIFDGTHWIQIQSTNNFTYATATVGSHVKVNGNYGTQETGVITLTTDATHNSTTATIVSRDASGNFAANMITANLTGVVTGSVSGNAGSVTNGVYTTGDQTIGGTKTFTSAVNGTITTATFAQSFNTGTLVTNAVNAQVATTTTNFNTGTLVTNAVNAQVATTTTNFNTGTLVANAVNARVATTTTNFNTGTLVANAVTARTATTATNLTVATSLFAGQLAAATGSVPKNSVATVTYTITGLTTNHKIIITPGTVMPDRQFAVVAAWVSSANTISIQYANNTGGAISVTLDINYFAFI